MNAKNELLKVLNKISKSNQDILCASITHEIYNWDEEDDIAEKFILKIGYSENELSNFIDSLDFEYDNGYGTQYIFGEVLFKDNSWLEREEYDGSEWWAYRKFLIPDECK